ncbi:ATP-binding cassette domain-containing protein [Nakamurella sp. YIM 132087]|uniref:ATP-binding cassette domain-containing protein n=1 Tax=Nakamurella alba TaxID=2665158 RepID=A0A7K1FHF3_9ACTN|nr:ABC transporter ATP-binding protein [Nakamurella alba]MTD13555.1 ATP-binding cassette domain-containing protein [Nakamurella alba]
MGMVLEADGLGKRYGSRWALQDCSFTLPEGRVAALVGPNGAGKSTLLQLAVGLLRPDAGSVRIFGQDPYDNVDVLADLGFVAQDTPLYRDFTAAELVRMGGKLNRSQWDGSVARVRLAQLGIPPDKKVGTLSGGQRAQVALALALAKRPRLLLLDEPVASLDPLARHEFLQALMGSVAETGTTVLLSSHLLADLERVCDQLVLVRSAQVQLAGAIDDILDEHRRLIGPRHDGRPIPGVATVIRESHTDRQSTLLVRTNGPVDEGLFTSSEVGLEDLILAYLDEPAPVGSHSAWGVPA